MVNDEQADNLSAISERANEIELINGKLMNKADRWAKIEQDNSISKAIGTADQAFGTDRWYQAENTRPI